MLHMGPPWIDQPRNADSSVPGEVSLLHMLAACRSKEQGLLLGDQSKLELVHAQMALTALAH